MQPAASPDNPRPARDSGRAQPADGTPDVDPESESAQLPHPRASETEVLALSSHGSAEPIEPILGPPAAPIDARPAAEPISGDSRPTAERIDHRPVIQPPGVELPPGPERATPQHQAPDHRPTAGTDRAAGRATPQQLGGAFGPFDVGSRDERFLFGGRYADLRPGASSQEPTKRNGRAAGVGKVNPNGTNGNSSHDLDQVFDNDGHRQRPAVGWASGPTSDNPIIEPIVSGSAVVPVTEPPTASPPALPPAKPTLPAVVEASGPEAAAQAQRQSASLRDAAPIRRGRRAAAEQEKPGLRPGDVTTNPLTFWDEDAARHFRAAWHEVKAEFVDDPVTALTRAHDLVTDAVSELTESLLAERDGLDPMRDKSVVDTENMRMAMRGYRELLDRILEL